MDGVGQTTCGCAVGLAHQVTQFNRSESVMRRMQRSGQQPLAAGIVTLLIVPVPRNHSCK